METQLLLRSWMRTKFNSRSGDHDDQGTLTERATGDTDVLACSTAQLPQHSGFPSNLETCPQTTIPREQLVTSATGEATMAIIPQLHTCTKSRPCIATLSHASSTWLRRCTRTEALASARQQKNLSPFNHTAHHCHNALLDQLAPTRNVAQTTLWSCTTADHLASYMPSGSGASK